MRTNYLIGFFVVAGLILAGYGWNQGWFRSILPASAQPDGTLQDDGTVQDTQYPDLTSPKTPLPFEPEIFVVPPEPRGTPVPAKTSEYSKRKVRAL